MRITTKAALPRRTFLRGVGASLALPLLDAMVPPLTAMARTAAKPVVRLGFVYIPNGVNVTSWVPTGSGPTLALSPTLNPLAPYLDRLLVVSGLAHRQAESMGDGGGDHSRGTAAWLSGTHATRTEGADVQAGTTADQIAAAVLGRETPLPSLELTTDQNDKMVGNCDGGYSCVYQNTIAWRDATTPLPMEVQPRVVFDRLFGSRGSDADIRTRRSILDTMGEQVARLQRRLAADDRRRVRSYLDSVREVERRIQAAERQNADSPVALPDRPVDIPEAFDEHAKVMFDLQAVAFQADVTRVITFQLGRELSGRTYPQIGVPEPHHSISHHRNDPALLDKLAKIDTYHVDLFGYFLDRLRSTPDGDGSLLDHVAILYGGGISDGNAHSHFNLPVVVAGGGAGQIEGGRHLVCADRTPMANLLVGLLDKAGVPLTQLGDSTGRLESLSAL